MKITLLNRILLLITALLAAWQVAVGIEGASTIPMITYTVGFGVLLVACLLLIILGMDVLESPIVVIASTIIPLSLALGLAWENLINFQIPYLIFALAGFLAILLTRILPMQNKIPVFVLALVHGIAGLTIFLLPLILVFCGNAKPGFALVGVGGALIGIGGLLLSFLKAGKPILSRETIFEILPGLLLVMAAAFVIGLNSHKI